MKKNVNICPGCSRGCCADAPRCKYGRKYFACQAGKVCPKACKVEKTKHKWERYVEHGDVLWHLLFAARKAKKALLQRKIAGVELLNALTPEEQETLRLLLGKLESKIKNSKGV